MDVKYIDNRNAIEYNIHRTFKGGFIMKKIIALVFSIVLFCSFIGVVPFTSAEDLPENQKIIQAKSLVEQIKASIDAKDIDTLLKAYNDYIELELTKAQKTELIASNDEYSGIIHNAEISLEIYSVLDAFSKDKNAKTAHNFVDAFAPYLNEGKETDLAVLKDMLSGVEEAYQEALPLAPSEEATAIVDGYNEFSKGFEEFDISLIYSATEKYNNAYEWDDELHRLDISDDELKSIGALLDIEETKPNSIMREIMEPYGFAQTLIEIDGLIKAYKQNKSPKTAKAFFDNDWYINPMGQFDWYSDPETAEKLYVVDDYWVIDMKLVYKFFPDYKDTKAEIRELLGALEIPQEDLDWLAGHLGENEEEIKEEPEKEEETVKSPQTGESDSVIIVFITLALSAFSLLIFSKKAEA